MIAHGLRVENGLLGAALLVRSRFVRGHGAAASATAKSASERWKFSQRFRARSRNGAGGR